MTTLDELEGRAPERGFWVAETLTVADLGLFGQLQALRTPLARPHAEELGPRGRLTAYLDRVDAATRLQLSAAESSAA